MGADSHSKMGVGKKIRRILSFKRKKTDDKPAIEAPKAEKTDKSNTLNGTKKSSSLISLSRKFSFGRGDKTKKDRSKKGTPPAPESAAPATPVAAPETIAALPLAAPEIVEAVPVVETPKPEIQTVVSEPAVQEVEVVSNEVTIEQTTETGSPLFEKVKPHSTQEEVEDIKDENACGDGIKVTAGQADCLSEEQSDKPAAVSSEPEEHCEVLSPAPAAAAVAEEPKTITEVINITHETNQTGDESVRTVQTEQERTIGEDGTTVISRSTKTTTTTVDGDGSQIKTETEEVVKPPISNGHSRLSSKKSVQQSSMLPVSLVIGAIIAVLSCLILYKLKDSGVLSLV